MRLVPVLERLAAENISVEIETNGTIVPGDGVPSMICGSTYLLNFLTQPIRTADGFAPKLCVD